MPGLCAVPQPQSSALAHAGVSLLKVFPLLSTPPNAHNPPLPCASTALSKHSDPFGRPDYPLVAQEVKTMFVSRL